ncbi:hypothetical protein AK812_SmicGene30888 [Symbiodinium microadriaticum]|uniref:Uncharacterized protein n=1 Tax=Symbiodinium microadriaticum TaxID=2951 RepID=A0A1Q9CY85_SYMMI|nr:hypothetical protein AK812_SmicGene30888 [Symbiodinium microadriaticum]
MFSEEPVSLKGLGYGNGVPMSCSAVCKVDFPISDEDLEELTESKEAEVHGQRRIPDGRHLCQIHDACTDHVPGGKLWRCFVLVLFGVGKAFVSTAPLPSTSASLEQDPALRMVAERLCEVFEDRLLDGKSRTFPVQELLGAEEILARMWFEHTVSRMYTLVSLGEIVSRRTWTPGRVLNPAPHYLELRRLMLDWRTGWRRFFSEMDPAAFQKHLRGGLSRRTRVEFGDAVYRVELARVVRIVDAAVDRTVETLQI